MTISVNTLQSPPANSPTWDSGWDSGDSSNDAAPQNASVPWTLTDAANDFSVVYNIDSLPGGLFYLYGYSSVLDAIIYNIKREVYNQSGRKYDPTPTEIYNQILYGSDNNSLDHLKQVQEWWYKGERFLFPSYNQHDADGRVALIAHGRDVVMPELQKQQQDTYNSDNNRMLKDLETVVSHTPEQIYQFWHKTGNAKTWFQSFEKYAAEVNGKAKGPLATFKEKLAAAEEEHKPHPKPPSHDISLFTLNKAGLKAIDHEVSNILKHRAGELGPLNTEDKRRILTEAARTYTEAVGSTKVGCALAFSFFKAMSLSIVSLGRFGIVWHAASIRASYTAASNAVNLEANRFGLTGHLRDMMTSVTATLTISTAVTAGLGHFLNVASPKEGYKNYIHWLNTEITTFVNSVGCWTLFKTLTHGESGLEAFNRLKKVFGRNDAFYSLGRFEHLWTDWHKLNRFERTFNFLAGSAAAINPAYQFISVLMPGYVAWVEQKFPRTTKWLPTVTVSVACIAQWVLWSYGAITGRPGK